MGGYSPFTVGRYSYVNPYTGAFTSYAYPAYQSSYAYSFYNPVTGRVMNYQINAVQPYSPYGYGGGGYGGYAAPYVPPAYGGGTTGGYGSYATSTNPIVNEQLRGLRASTYQNSYPSGGEYGGAKEVYSPRWTTGPAKAPADGAAGKPSDVDATLVSASEKDILSARVLNALVAEVRRLEETGAKAEAPLLPAEVLSRVAFEGPGAGLLAAARAGKPAFPPAMAGAAFADLRADLERQAQAVLEPVAQGKAADAAAADRLGAAARKAKDAPAVRALPADDAAAVAKFLDGLDGLAKEAKDPSLAGVVPAKWNGMGATATDLVRHMGRHKLLIAPAPAGSEQAYAALHRGLSGYYVALAQAKK
jgi:hypothetical protein